ncbi:RNA polymerase II fifth largest subunit putative isoform 2 [Tripterygium wilfordii]|uniref:RNA polymerase II fifth largest subunit putative isoform 2 n=1 Tax=Tripterygium wilfordii TaxID=458696 RepID=A0A7J7C5B8_TRIWF|nr:DNA-directed RNA polymerase V subunit 5C [Tripterygium wilfordii]KAF5729314.1 RNA polymerase II fifth largest subunit putative isoform 2 [Tripterygium wilfordii]
MAAITGGNGGDGRLECMTSFVFKGSVQSYRYYLSRRTVLEMLRDRGYDVADAELIRSQTEFRAVFGEDPDLERLRIRVSLRSDPRKKILVIFMGTNVITKPSIRALRGQILHEQLHGLILILQSKMNAFARKELQTFGFKVEIFQITDLLSNVTKHLLMPKVEVLTAEEKIMLMKKYKLEDKQLPQMLATDAVARYYGLEKGNVVKFSYAGGLADSIETYRNVA